MFIIFKKKYNGKVHFLAHLLVCCCKSHEFHEGSNTDSIQPMISLQDPAASTDINGNDTDPMPQFNGQNHHGTQCAGEVSSVAFNDFCGVGLAYNASVGGNSIINFSFY